MATKVVNLVQIAYENIEKRVSIIAECDGQKKRVYISFETLTNVSGLSDFAEIAYHFTELRPRIVEVLEKYFTVRPDLGPVFLSEKDLNK